MSLEQQSTEAGMHVHGNELTASPETAQTAGVLESRSAENVTQSPTGLGIGPPEAKSLSADVLKDSEENDSVLRQGRPATPGADEKVGVLELKDNPMYDCRVVTADEESLVPFSSAISGIGDEAASEACRATNDTVAETGVGTKGCEASGAAAVSRTAVDKQDRDEISVVSAASVDTSEAKDPTEVVRDTPEKSTVEEGPPVLQPEQPPPLPEPVCTVQAKQGPTTSKKRQSGASSSRSSNLPPVLEPEVITLDDDDQVCVFEEPPLLLPEVAVTRRRKGIVRKRNFFGDTIDSSILKETVLEGSPAKKPHKSSTSQALSKPSTQTDFSSRPKGDGVTVLISRCEKSGSESTSLKQKSSAKTAGSQASSDGKKQQDQSACPPVFERSSSEKPCHITVSITKEAASATGHKTTVTGSRDKPLARRMGSNRQPSRRSGAARCGTSRIVHGDGRLTATTADRRVTATGWRSVVPVQLGDLSTQCGYATISGQAREAYAPVPPPPGDLVSVPRDHKVTERVRKVAGEDGSDLEGVFMSADLEGFLEEQAALKLSFPVPDVLMRREQPCDEEPEYPAAVEPVPAIERPADQPRFKTLLEKQVWFGIRDAEDLRAARSAPSPSAKDSHSYESLPLHSLLLPPRYLTPARASRDLAVHRAGHLLPLCKVMHKSLDTRRAWDDPAKGADCVQYVYDRHRQVRIRGSATPTDGPTTRAFGKLVRPEAVLARLSAWRRRDYRVSTELVSRQTALLVSAAVRAAPAEVREKAPVRDPGPRAPRANARTPRASPVTARQSPRTTRHSPRNPKPRRRLLVEDTEPHPKAGNVTGNWPYPTVDLEDAAAAENIIDGQPKDSVADRQDHCISDQHTGNRELAAVDQQGSVCTDSEGDRGSFRLTDLSADQQKGESRNQAQPITAEQDGLTINETTRLAAEQLDSVVDNPADDGPHVLQEVARSGGSADCDDSAKADTALQSSSLSGAPSVQRANSREAEVQACLGPDTLDDFSAVADVFESTCQNHLEEQENGETGYKDLTMTDVVSGIGDKATNEDVRALNVTLSGDTATKSRGMAAVSSSPPPEGVVSSTLPLRAYPGGRMLSHACSTLESGKAMLTDRPFQRGVVAHLEDRHPEPAGFSPEDDPDNASALEKGMTPEDDSVASGGQDDARRLQGDETIAIKESAAVSALTSECFASADDTVAAEGGPSHSSSAENVIAFPGSDMARSHEMSTDAVSTEGDVLPSDDANAQAEGATECAGARNGLLPEHVAEEDAGMEGARRQDAAAVVADPHPDDMMSAESNQLEGSLSQSEVPQGGSRASSSGDTDQRSSVTRQEVSGLRDSSSSQAENGGNEADVAPAKLLLESPAHKWELESCSRSMVGNDTAETTQIFDPTKKAKFANAEVDIGSAKQDNIQTDLSTTDVSDGRLVADKTGPHLVRLKVLLERAANPQSRREADLQENKSSKEAGRCSETTRVACASVKQENGAGRHQSKCFNLSSLNLAQTVKTEDVDETLEQDASHVPLLSRIRDCFRNSLIKETPLSDPEENVLTGSSDEAVENLSKPKDVAEADTESNDEKSPTAVPSESPDTVAEAAAVTEESSGGVRPSSASGATRHACVHLPLCRLTAVRPFCLFHEVHDCPEYRPGGSCYMLPPRQRIVQLGRGLAIRTGRLPPLPARHLHAARTFGRVRRKVACLQPETESCVASLPLPDGSPAPPPRLRFRAPDNVDLAQVTEVVLLTPARACDGAQRFGVRLRSGALVPIGPGAFCAGVPWRMQPADNVTVTSATGRLFRNASDRDCADAVDVEGAPAELLQVPLAEANRRLDESHMVLTAAPNGSLTLAPVRTRVLAKERLRRVAGGRSGRRELFSTGNLVCMNNGGKLSVIGAVALDEKPDGRTVSRSDVERAPQSVTGRLGGGTGTSKAGDTTAAGGGSDVSERLAAAPGAASGPKTSVTSTGKRAVDADVIYDARKRPRVSGSDLKDGARAPQPLSVPRVKAVTSVVVQPRSSSGRFMPTKKSPAKQPVKAVPTHPRVPTVTKCGGSSGDSRVDGLSRTAAKPTENPTGAGTVKCVRRQDVDGAEKRMGRLSATGVLMSVVQKIASEKAAPATKLVTVQAPCATKGSVVESNVPLPKVASNIHRKRPGCHSSKTVLLTPKSQGTPQNPNPVLNEADVALTNLSNGESDRKVGGMASTPPACDPARPKVRRKSWADLPMWRRSWSDARPEELTPRRRSWDNPSARQSWADPAASSGGPADWPRARRRSAEQQGARRPTADGPARHRSGDQPLSTPDAGDQQGSRISPAAELALHQPREHLASRPGGAGDSRRPPTLLRADDAAVKRCSRSGAESPSGPQSSRPPGPESPPDRRPTVIDLTSPEKASPSRTDGADAAAAPTETMEVRKRLEMPLEVLLLNESDMSDDGMEDLEAAAGGSARVPDDVWKDDVYCPNIELIEL